MKTEKQKPVQESLLKIAFKKFRQSSMAVKIIEGIILTATIAIPLWITETRPYVWFILGLVCIGLVHFAYIYAREYKLKIRATIIIFTCCIVIIGGLSFIAILLTTNDDPCENPRTLYDYFDCADFKGVKVRVSANGVGHLWNAFTGETAKVAYDRKIYIDFENMTYFFTYYCHNEKLVIPFCLHVPTLVDEVLNDKKFLTDVIPNIYRDKAKSLTDLTFTKQIYIYVDDVINVQQEAEIRDKFEKHKPEYKVILRTRLYTMFKEHGYESIPE